jgi:hypothetical protein
MLARHQRLRRTSFIRSCECSILEKQMDQAPNSLADRFRMALDLCDAAGARADATPVVSELRQRHVTFEQPRIFPSQPVQSSTQPVHQPLLAEQPVPHPPMAQGVSEDLCTRKGDVSSTLKAIAAVVLILLAAGAVWFLKQRLMAVLMRRRQAKSEEAAPLEVPRRSWRQPEPQKRPAAPRRVTFSAQVEEPRPPQPTRGRRSAETQEEARRRALLAAQKSASARQKVAAEVAAEDSGEEGEADPNFTEL